jgi:hypothetical protein
VEAQNIREHDGLTVRGRKHAEFRVSMELAKRRWKYSGLDFARRATLAIRVVIPALAVVAPAFPPQQNVHPPMAVRQGDAAGVLQKTLKPSCRRMLATDLMQLRRQSAASLRRAAELHDPPAANGPARPKRGRC